MVLEQGIHFPVHKIMRKNFIISLDRFNNISMQRMLGILYGDRRARKRSKNTGERSLEKMMIDILTEVEITDPIQAQDSQSKMQNKAPVFFYLNEIDEQKYGKDFKLTSNAQDHSR